MPDRTIDELTRATAVYDTDLMILQQGGAAKSMPLELLKAFAEAAAAAVQKGDPGATGNGIQSISKVSTAGTVDTYSITMTDGTSYTFTVTNGTGSVDSVNGKNGAVTLTAADVGARGLDEYDDLDNLNFGHRNGDSGEDTVISNGIVSFSTSPTFSDIGYTGWNNRANDAGEIVISSPFIAETFGIMLGAPFDPDGTLEVAGCTSRGHGIITDARMDGQILTFSIGFPFAKNVQPNSSGEAYLADTVRAKIMAQGPRATPKKTIGSPWTTYRNAVKAAVNSYFATRLSDSNPTGLRYYYDNNWSQSETYAHRVIKLWKDDDGTILYRPTMQCDTFSLMCMSGITYDNSPYAEKTSGGDPKNIYADSDFTGWPSNRRRYVDEDTGEQYAYKYDYDNWNPWADTSDPMGSYSRFSKMKKFTTYGINKRLTWASRMAWYMWHINRVFIVPTPRDGDKTKTKIQKIPTNAELTAALADGDLIFFRKYQPDYKYEYYDLVTHVGIITIEQINGVSTAVLNHVTDYETTKDLDGINSKTCLHRHALAEYLVDHNCIAGRYYFARPYTG